MDSVQRYRRRNAERDNRALFAELCLHYSQYTLTDAADLPIGDVRLLVNYARLDRAEVMLQLLGIVVSTEPKNYGKTSGALREAVTKLRGLL